MPRFGHSAVVYNGSMYIYGGFNGQTKSDILVFTPGECSHVKVRIFSTNNPTKLFHVIVHFSILRKLNCSELGTFVLWMSRSMLDLNILLFLRIVKSFFYPAWSGFLREL